MFRASRYQYLGGVNVFSLIGFLRYCFVVWAGWVVGLLCFLEQNLQNLIDFYHNSFKITRKLAPGRYLEALGSLWGTKGGAMNGIWGQLLVRWHGFGRSLGSLFVIFFVVFFVEKKDCPKNHFF